MKKELPKQQACKACVLLPLMLCFLLTATSLRAATWTINKTTGTISVPDYSPGDTLVISGNAFASADWNALRLSTTGYHLILETADVNIPDKAFDGCTGLRSVSSSALIKTLGIGAFANCGSLTAASFPNVTNIGKQSFQLCNKLANVSFPMAETIGEEAFSYCISLTTGSYPNVTTIGEQAFQNCVALTDVSFPNATTLGRSAFGDCTGLTTASFPSAPTTGFYTFQNCKKLTNVSFPNATDIGEGSFVNCLKLANVSFPNAVTIVNQAFRNCPALTTTSFPNVMKIGNGAFGSCTALTSISFPIVTYIGDSAFTSCNKLINAYFPNVISISDSVFAYCSNLASLTLGDRPPFIGGTNAFSGVSPLLLVVPDSTTYTPLPTDFPAGSEAFNKNVPTQRDGLAYGKPYDLVPNHIPTLPGGTYRWEKDGITIPGATGPTYQATTPGLYTLRYFHGEQVTLLSTYLAATSYDLYGTNNRYQGCGNVLQLTFTQPTAARTIEVWSEGTGAGSLYDTQSGKYFKDKLTYKLAAGDSLLTIPYAVDEDVKDGSHATFVYRIAPAGTIERTDQFTLYAVPDIKLVTYYPTTAQFKGVLDISITNSSYYMQRSLDGGQSWQFARDTVTGEVLPFSQSQLAGFLPGTTILFRVPNGCSYNSLTVGNKDDVDPFITRQVTMPSVPDAISSVDYGVYSVYSGDNFTFTITPTGANAGKMPQVTTSRTRLPDSEGVVTINNGDGSYTVTILQIQEAIAITIDFATGTETIDGDAVWASGNRLYIRPLVSGEASVYTIAGALVQKVNVAAGEQVTVPLNGGVYFVKLNGKTHKIIINY